MICPLISNRIKYTTNSVFIECKKEECAWYNKYKEDCCIKVLSEKIEEVVEGQRTIYTREV